MTAMSSIYFEVDTAVGGWQWRIRGENHEIMSSSEILTRRETGGVAKCERLRGDCRAEKCATEGQREADEP